MKDEKIKRRKARHLDRHHLNLRGARLTPNRQNRIAARGSLSALLLTRGEATGEPWINASNLGASEALHLNHFASTQLFQSRHLIVSSRADLI